MRRCGQCWELFEPRRDFHRLCWPCWKARNTSTPREEREHARPWSYTPTAPLLDEQTLRAAVALCHPDRHPGARLELATKTTAALLDALETVRGVT